MQLGWVQVGLRLKVRSRWQFGLYASKYALQGGVGVPGWVEERLPLILRTAFLNSSRSIWNKLSREDGGG